MGGASRQMVMSNQQMHHNLEQRKTELAIQISAYKKLEVDRNSPRRELETAKAHEKRLESDLSVGRVNNRKGDNGVEAMRGRLELLENHYQAVQGELKKEQQSNLSLQSLCGQDTRITKPARSKAKLRR